MTDFDDNNDYETSTCPCCGLSKKWYDKICDVCYSNDYEKEINKAVRYGKNIMVSFRTIIYKRWVLDDFKCVLMAEN